MTYPGYIGQTVNRSDNVTRRIPRCYVQFLTERALVVDSQYLMAVKTSKSLGQASGSFQIFMAANAVPNRNRGGVSTSKVTSDVEGGYWLREIQPLTLVQIVFTQRSLSVTDENGLRIGVGDFTESSDSDTPDPDELNEIVMVGLVDSVTLEKHMTPKGPQRYIRIEGRDMSKPLTDDMHLSFGATPFLQDQADQGKKVPYTILSRVPSTSDEQRQELTRYFATSTESDSWRNVSLYKTIGEVVNALLNNAPGLNVTLRNGLDIRKFFAQPAISDDLAQTPYAGFQVLGLSGSVWSILTSILPTPFAEVFVDTVGRNPQVIIRRPPWGRLFPDQQEITSQYINQLADPNFPSDIPLFTTDEVLSTPTRITGEFAHLISDDEITSMTVGRSSQDIVSQYWTNPTSQSIGIQQPFGSLGALYPIIFDLDAVTQYGVRVMQTENPWWPALSNATDAAAPQFDNGGAVNETQYKLAQINLDNLRSYFWFRDNDVFLSGMVKIMGRPQIRIGDYVILTSYNRVFYVEAVTNTWDFGSVFETTLYLTRGQPLDVNDIRNVGGLATETENGFGF